MRSRQYAAELFRRTLARVDVGERMRAQIACSARILRIGDCSYRLSSYDRVLVIAVGKASESMTSALLQTLVPCLQEDQRLEGIVIGGDLPENRHPRFAYFAGGHPTPDASSREAAEEALRLLRTAGPQTLILFLVSGGASAMLEKPLWDDISVEETAAFYKQLVHSGLSITEMNCVRKHFSAVKGGRLAQAAEGATQCTIVVSDVPDGSLDVIGSGPSMPDPTTIEDCRRLLEQNGFADHLPPRVRGVLSAADLPETVKAGSLAFANASFLSLLSNADLLREASALAHADGFYTLIDNSCDDWEYMRAAEYLLSRMEELRPAHGRVCLLSGGELSVPLPPDHGAGGRNQQFALFCVLRLSEAALPITVLSAGTDGLDGNSPAAGAVVDERTASELHSAGISPEISLKAFDAYTALEKTGAVLVTGPTGNNLRDIRMLLCDDDRERAREP